MDIITLKNSQKVEGTVSLNEVCMKHVKKDWLLQKKVTNRKKVDVSFIYS